MITILIYQGFAGQKEKDLSKRQVLFFFILVTLYVFDMNFSIV